MIEKLGPGKFALPVLVVVLVGCVMALMFYPMLNMAPRDMPFAVMSQDEGAQTPQGDVNAGEAMADKLVDAEAPAGQESAPIEWHRVSSQDELEAAVADNQYYGALTIPADFTQKQALAQAGEGEAPSVHVVLDNAKSPMAATQMQALMSGMFEQMGVSAEVELIHTGDADAGSSSPVAGMMGQQIAVMPLMVMSMIGAVILSRILPSSAVGVRGAKRSTGGRFARLGLQLAYAAGLALVAALATVALLNGLVGAEAPFWTTTIFLWFACFAVMSLFLGAFNIALPVGALAVLLVFVCGMMTAVLPAEMLPVFWADWIYPWVPQPFIADGIRDILYMGADLMPRGSGGLLGIGCVGIVLLAVSGLISRSTSKELGTAGSGEGAKTLATA